MRRPGHLLAVVPTMIAAMLFAPGPVFADEDTRPVVTSTDYRDPAIEPDLNYNVGVSGLFTFRSRIADPAFFVWRTDDGQSGEVPAADRTGSVRIAPRRAGVQSLTVHTVDTNKTAHAEYAYKFLVDDGPTVVRDPAGDFYLGSSPTFHMTPRAPGVVEYVLWPLTYAGERRDQAVTVPAKADGTAETSWYMSDSSLAALLVQSREAGGGLSAIRTVWAGPNPAAPVLTRTGGDDLITPAVFTVRTGMPEVVAYDVTVNGVRQSVPPVADGSATFTFTPTVTGTSTVTVTARNARGLKTAESQESWRVVDFPSITSTDFPLGLIGAYGRKAPGTFQFASRMPATTAFEWTTGAEWAALPASADGTATLTWTPDRTGGHTIRVRAVAADGTRSSLGAANFSVAVVNARVGSVSPSTVTTGEKRSLTITGMNLHPLDVVLVTPAGGESVPATIRSVDPDGYWTIVDADFTSVRPGRASVTVQGYGATQWATLTNVITVDPLPGLALTKAPAISGRVQVGRTVTTTAGTWSPAATTVRYQWKANGVALAGATGPAYRIPAAVAGKRLSVTVTASRAGHQPTISTSAPTTAVAKAAAAKATKRPAIIGTAKVGRTVKATTGTWSPTGNMYVFEWRLNGKAIRGATGRTLKLTAAMRGKRLTVTVIAMRAGHLDGRAVSAAVTIKR
jgi:hypothetical protein